MDIEQPKQKVLEAYEFFLKRSKEMPQEKWGFGEKIAESVEKYVQSHPDAGPTEKQGVWLVKMFNEKTAIKNRKRVNVGVYKWVLDSMYEQGDLSKHEYTTLVEFVKKNGYLSWGALSEIYEQEEECMLSI